MHVVQAFEAQLRTLRHQLATQTQLTSSGVLFSAQMRGQVILAMACIGSLERSQAALRTALAERVSALNLTS